MGLRALPSFPSRKDPYDRGGGAHPNPDSTWTGRVSAASLGARLGVGTAVSVGEVKPRSWGYRVSTITVTGVKDGRRTSVTMTGTQFRTALKLKSTKFHVDPSERFRSGRRWPMRIRYTAARLEVARAVPVPAPAGSPHPGRRALAPPGWATVTVTAAAGGVAARPAVSRVSVDRTAPPAGTSTSGFSKGAWKVNNASAQQLSRSARVFSSYRFDRAGDIPVVGDWDGDGTQTVGVVRPSRAAGTNRLLLRNSRGPF